MKKYFLSKNFVAGLIILICFFIFYFTGIFFCQYEYDQIDVLNKFASFSKEHIFGTDYLGRDVYSRILEAFKISFIIGFTVMFLGLVTGTILGAIAGYFGNIPDAIISKLINIQMSFPGLLIALMLIAVFGTSFNITIIALYIMSIPSFTRIARAGFLQYKNSLFVLSAKAKGASNLRIIFIHIFPNILPELLITSTLNFSLSILSESGLSYLGLGVQPPIPSFGKMLNESQRFILQNPSNILIPAFFLILLVLSLNLIGEGISEVQKL